MPYGCLANTSSRTHRLQAFFFSICCLWLVRHCLSTGLFGSLCFSLHLSSGAECSTLTIHLPCHSYQRHMDVSWWPIRNSPASSQRDILANQVFFLMTVIVQYEQKKVLNIYMSPSIWVTYMAHSSYLKSEEEHCIHFAKSCHCHMHTDVCWHRNGTKVLINHFLSLLQCDFIILIIRSLFQLCSFTMYRRHISH